MKRLAAAAVALMALTAAAKAEPAALAPDMHYVLAQKLQNVTLETGARLNKLVLASAETRVQAKIDNLQFQKPYQQNLPAFAMLSAFTID